MKVTHVIVVASFLVAAGAPAAFAQATGSKPAAAKQAEQHSAVPQTPEWLRLTSLVGMWEGTMGEGQQAMPATVEVRMTGGGSAIMHVLGKGSPYEMVTMIHPDGKRLLATHYCAAHNQPRMALVPSAAPNQLAFTFVDGTNIAPGDEHMRSVVFTFVDADHHTEAWTSSGSPTPMLFTFTRKK
jgi:hypothetical protein